MNSESNTSQPSAPETSSPPIGKGILPLITVALLVGTVWGWWHQTPPDQPQSRTTSLQAPFQAAFKHRPDQSSKISFPEQTGTRINLFNLVDLNLPQPWTLIPSSDPTCLIATLTKPQQPGPVLLIRILPIDSFEEGWAILNQTEAGTVLRRSPIQVVNPGLQTGWTDVKFRLAPAALPSTELGLGEEIAVLQRRQYVVKKLMTGNNEEFLLVYISIATESTEARFPLTLQDLIEISEYPNQSGPGQR